MRREELYIETWVDADLADLWAATQDPDEHERWDLRFTDIEYLPRPDESAPQQFDYETRIGFGIGVAGGGESTSERADGGSAREASRTSSVDTSDGGPASEAKAPSSDGQSDRCEQTSALRFWSDDPKSLITEGTGYWKYLPEDGGVRFLTAYNYETRFGRLGRAIDRLVFRPLMVWATAWSFDRLRLWLEADVSPEASMRQSVVHAVARLSLAFVWAYQGLVPKLAGPHPVERALSGALLPAGVPLEPTVYALGAVEVAFGLTLLLAWHRRWLFALSAVGTVMLVGAGLLARPALLAHPLSTVPLGIAMLGLAVAGHASADGLPSASRCITDREESEAT